MAKGGKERTKHNGVCSKEIDRLGRGRKEKRGDRRVPVLILGESESFCSRCTSYRRRERSTRRVPVVAMHRKRGGKKQQEGYIQLRVPSFRNPGMPSPEKERGGEGRIPIFRRTRWLKKEKKDGGRGASSACCM